VMPLEHFGFFGQVSWCLRVFVVRAVYKYH
jgi:hypothetical protein